MRDNLEFHKFRKLGISRLKYQDQFIIKKIDKKYNIEISKFHIKNCK